MGAVPMGHAVWPQASAVSRHGPHRVPAPLSWDAHCEGLLPGSPRLGPPEASGTVSVPSETLTRQGPCTAPGQSEVSLPPAWPKGGARRRRTEAEAEGFIDAAEGGWGAGSRLTIRQATATAPAKGFHCTAPDTCSVRPSASCPLAVRMGCPLHGAEGKVPPSTSEVGAVAAGWHPSHLVPASLSPRVARQVAPQSTGPLSARGTCLPQETGRGEGWEPRGAQGRGWAAQHYWKS